ncbi:META domain-containing protein [Streptomyces sp. NPDC004629]|uniref:META domain-containing protein n=1 Tax=Streptomyces sp. NPDC004629 TaxID=3364705 RepID=UPI003681EE91
MDSTWTRNRKRRRLTLMAPLVLLPLVACGSERADGGSGSVRASVTGVRWSVDSVTVDGTMRRAPAGAYAEFADGRVRGNYGCNHFSALAAFDGDRLTLEDAGVTEMGCAQEPMAFERALARTLADGPLTTRVRGGELTLVTEAGDTVRLTEEPDAPLRGSKWMITALGADGPDGPDGTAASPPGGAAPYLVFGEKSGRVTGSLGCNRVTAKATVRDAHITLGTPATTRMVCDVSLMHTEKSLLRLFGGTVGYRLDHRSLTLTSENGEWVSAVAEP